MSYAEAKQIALLRLELRACWERRDREAAGTVLARLTQAAGNDNELTAEVRRWEYKLALYANVGAGRATRLDRARAVTAIRRSRAFRPA